MERKWKLRYLVALAIISVLSTILLLIGFFTPQWLVSHSENQECSTMGLISGSCRYLYPHNDKGHRDVAILALVSSSMSTTLYPSDVGFHAIFSIIAGGLMLICYGGLLVYDDMYTSSRVKEPERKESKQSSKLAMNLFFFFSILFFFFSMILGTIRLVYYLSGI